MVSSQGAPASPNGPVLLQLLKYSTATVPIDSVAPVPWKHLSNKSKLFAQFITSRSRSLDGSIEERSAFKVLQDPDILEDLDLEQLSREAQRAIQVSEDAVQHNRDQYVAVIVKVPVIAVKYPTSDGQVRRFQIRFANDEGFYEAMKLFSRANVPALEAGTFPTQRPGTATSHGSSNAAAFTSVSARPATATGGISNTTSRFFSSHVPAPVERATTASALVMIPPPRMATTTAPEPRKPDNYIGPYIASPVICQTIDNLLAEADKVGPETLAASHCEDQNRQAAKSAIDLYTPRPSTAPGVTSQHLSQLPPRRELPFTKRDGGARNTAARPSATEHISRLSGSQAKAQSAQAPEPVSEIDGQKAQAIDETSRPGAIQRKRPATRASTKKKASTDSGIKKPRATTSRKKKGKETKESTPVPSVEELLKKHAADTREEQVIDPNAMDTQALLDKVGHLQEAKLHAQGIKPGHLKAVPVDVAAPRLEILDSQASISAGQPLQATDLPPCTPADKLINAGTPLAPAAAHTANKFPTQDDSSPIKYQPLRTTSEVPQQGDPNLTNWKQKGDEWAAQSEADKHRGVKDFARQCLWDDNFMELCKVMEPLVETAMMSDRFDRYVGSRGET